MSVSLQTRWARQLEASQVDPSWKAHIEKRVLRFLLARYTLPGEAIALGYFPFYEAESPLGRARVSPSRRQLRRRLEHIARVVREAQLQQVSFADGWFQRGELLQQKPELVQKFVVEALGDLEEFVECQIEAEVEARYQDAIRARRW